MVSLIDLWLPILVSAVLVFVASSVIHMALRWHAGDWKRLPAEDSVLDAFRSFGLAPGDYMAPQPGSMAEMNTPEFKEKVARGPRVAMTVLAPGSSMLRSLALWFVYSIVVALFAGYVAGTTLAAGAPYLMVFRVTSHSSATRWRCGRAGSGIRAALATRFARRSTASSMGC